MHWAQIAGNHLHWGKQELKRLGIKRKFQHWVEHDCGIGYSRANKFMRLVTAITEGSIFAKLGLTEAYERLGLITRKSRAGKPTSSTPASSTAANAGGANGTTADSAGGTDSATADGGSAVRAPDRAPPPRWHARS